MNIALIGYGNMGREVEHVALERGHTITTIINDYETLQKADLSCVDVAIEFTRPSAVINNIRWCVLNGLSMVVGTTGWSEHLEEVKEMIKSHDIGFIWSTNFSIGVCLFWKIIECAATCINSVEDYDVFVHELHHNQKKDSPSGTARTIGEILLRRIGRKKQLVIDRLDRVIKREELHVSSTRGGAIFGTHTVYLDSPYDTIELTHRAKSRRGFAVGAVCAAEWIKGKHGYYEMEDFMSNNYLCHI